MCVRDRERGTGVAEFQICIEINKGTEVEGNRNRK